MPVPVELLTMMECCLNNDGHYVKDAILLSCGANACKRCLNELSLKKEFKCYKCNRMHKIDEYLKQPYGNPAIDVLVEKIYVKELIYMISSGFMDALNKLDGLKYEEQIEKNYENIEFDIEIRIESLKNDLDRVRDILKEKLNEMRTKITANTCEKIQSMKQYILNTQRSFSVNLDNFREYQQKLYECKREIDNFTRNVPQIAFEWSDLDLEDKLIGRIIEKHPFRYDKIKFSKSVKLPSTKFMSSMSYSEVDNQLLITDNDENSIKVVDLNSKHVRINESIEFKTITKPLVTCSSPNGNLVYVADGDRKRIVVYKKHNYEFVTEFGDGNIKNPDSMCIDPDTNLLYITEFDNNYVSVWNLDANKYHTQFKVDSPAQIQIVDDKIYVISENDYEHVKTTGRIRITKGTNSIFVINKNTNQIESKIKLDDWFDPCGLIVDKNQNIITTAFELDADKYVSQKRFLYIFDRNFKMIKKLALDVEYFTDMTLVDRKIYFCSYNDLKIIEFE